MKTKYFFVLSLAIALTSCSENNGNTSNSGEVDLESAIENAESRRKADPNAKGGNKCLLDYQSKYDALVSEAEVLAATGFSKDVMETKNNNKLKNPEYHEFVYRFKNKRTGYVKALKREMEVPDVVALRAIAPMSLQSFQQTYRAITDEEMKVATDALNDVVDGNSDDARADAAMEKTREKNISKDQIKKTGGVLTDAFKEVSEGYRNVDGLGDAAVWNVVTNELTVLQNGVKFEIRTDISNDTEKNKSVAVELAKIILNKCK